VNSNKRDYWNRLVLNLGSFNKLRPIVTLTA
jgi:hypothetical protein